MLGRAVNPAAIIFDDPPDGGSFAVGRTVLELALFLGAIALVGWAMWKDAA